MITAAEIEPISIRGRFAFAVTCLERVCHTWGICSPALDRLLKHMLTFTVSMRLDEWVIRVNQLSPHSASDLADEFGLSHLPWKRLELLSKLIEAVLEVGDGNLFGGYKSEFTLPAVLQALALTRVADAEPPKLSTFARSNAREAHGWGDPVPPTFFGIPIRPVTIDSRWLTSTVLDLTTAIYQDRAFERMPVLSDALMDAGCDNEEIIGHCRSDGPHARGCWVIDLILGME